MKRGNDRTNFGGMLAQVGQEEALPPRYSCIYSFSQTTIEDRDKRFASYMSTGVSPSESSFHVSSKSSISAFSHHG
jgi:hypothetical protein